MIRIYKINFSLKLLIILIAELGFLSTLESSDKKIHLDVTTSSPLLVSIKKRKNITMRSLLMEQETH